MPTYSATCSVLMPWQAYWRMKCYARMTWGCFSARCWLEAISLMPAGGTWMQGGACVPGRFQGFTGGSECLSAGGVPLCGTQPGGSPAHGERAGVVALVKHRATVGGALATSKPWQMADRERPALLTAHLDTWPVRTLSD